VPADDPCFRRINAAQWYWYGAQLTADEEEKFELLRDVAEHNAMFWNPDGVDQIRQGRDHTFKTQDGEFEGFVKDLFGRDISLPDKPQAGIQQSGNFMDVFQGLDGETNERPRMRSDVDASPYLDAELDDIAFIPFKE